MPETDDAAKLRPAERLPAFPPMWIGFALAALFFLAEIIEVQVIDLRFPNTSGIGPIPLALALAGFIYWLCCIHRLHRILGAIAPGGYPISPGQAAWFHLIPLFNLFWLVRWPYRLANFIQAQGSVSILNGQLLGLFLLASLLLGRLVDGGLGLAALFGVTTYITGKIRQQVQVGHRTRD
jgi:predicted Co/Zn/Cd cation transporter (cation efflux family)